MQVLVTGGAGFIGGHLAEAFVEDGHHVTALDNFEPFYDLDLKRKTVETCRVKADNAPGEYELVEGDIRNEDLVEALVADADVVVHQAAQAGVRTSVDEPRKVVDINVDGTVNLLQAGVDHDIDRFIMASSSSVYGKPEYLPYDEAHPNEPVSPYGVTKLSKEHMARVYHELHDLPTVCLRYFTVYGPRMRPNMAISNFVSRCYHDEPPVIYGDGLQTRDFTYVDDIVGVNQTLLASGAADGEVLNVGSTDTIEIRRLAEVVRDRLSPDQELVYDEAIEADARHTHADVSKAGELLDYDPSTDIVEGVNRFIDWYDENRDWYEPLVKSS